MSVRARARARFLSQPSAVYLCASGNNAPAVTAGVILRSTGADETMGPRYLLARISPRIMRDRIRLDRGGRDRARVRDWLVVYARFRRLFNTESRRNKSLACANPQPTIMVK